MKDEAQITGDDELQEEAKLIGDDLHLIERNVLSPFFTPHTNNAQWKYLNGVHFDTKNHQYRRRHTYRKINRNNGTEHGQMTQNLKCVKVLRCS